MLGQYWSRGSSAGSMIGSPGDGSGSKGRGSTGLSGSKGWGSSFLGLSGSMGRGGTSAGLPGERWADGSKQVREYWVMGRRCDGNNEQANGITPPADRGRGLIRVHLAFQLTTYFTGLIGVAMDVNIKAPCLEGIVLRIGQFCIGRN